MSGMYRDRVKKKRISFQRMVQLVSAVLVNGYIIGFQKGEDFHRRHESGLCPRP